MVENRSERSPKSPKIRKLTGTGKLTSPDPPGRPRPARLVPRGSRRCRGLLKKLLGVAGGLQLAPVARTPGLKPFKNQVLDS